MENETLKKFWLNVKTRIIWVMVIIGGFLVIAAISANSVSATGYVNLECEAASNGRAWNCVAQTLQFPPVSSYEWRYNNGAWSEGGPTRSIPACRADVEVRVYFAGMDPVEDRVDDLDLDCASGPIAVIDPPEIPRPPHR